MLILFGAGVGASDCASACGAPGATGRWILGLSLIIFILPLVATPRMRVLLRRLPTLVTSRKPGSKGRPSLLSRLVS